jgi:hypothetical protein
VQGGAFWSSFFCYLSLDLDLDDLAFLFLTPFFFPPFPAMTRGTSNLKPRRITYPKGVFLSTGRPPRAVQREGGRKESERRERERRGIQRRRSKKTRNSPFPSPSSLLSPSSSSPFARVEFVRRRPRVDQKARPSGEQKMGERRKEEEKEKVKREGEETLIPTLRDPPLSLFPRPPSNDILFFSNSLSRSLSLQTGIYLFGRKRTHQSRKKASRGESKRRQASFLFFFEETRFEDDLPHFFRILLDASLFQSPAPCSPESRLEAGENAALIFRYSSCLRLRFKHPNGWSRRPPRGASKPTSSTERQHLTPLRAMPSSLPLPLPAPGLLRRPLLRNSDTETCELC